VPDGLAAAGGRIYAVTVDGQVLSIAAARPDRP